MNEVEITGHVIVRARELEQALRRAGAGTTTGIHDATTELGDKLSPECVRKLRFIASIRNRVAHGEALSEPIDMEAFNAACDEVARALTKINRGKTKLDAIPVAPEDAPAAALDVEFQLKVRRSVRLCGTIPMLNTLYFAALVVYALSTAARALFMLVLFAIAAPMLIEWARSRDGAMLMFGGVFFVAHWALTIVYAVGFNKELPKVKWYYYSVPLLSVGYLGWCVGRLTARAALVTGFVPLALNIAAPFFIRSDYRVALALVAAAWIIGIIAVVVRRKRFF